MSASDDFNRTDNTVLGTNWTNRKGGDTAFGIASNKASIGVNQDSASFWNANSFAADQYSQAALSALSGTNTGTGNGVCVRCDTTNLGGGATYVNFYYAVVNTAATNNVRIAKVVADVYTQLGQVTQAWTDGDVLRIEAQGTTIRAYRNGVQLGTDMTDSAISIGAAGIMHNASFATGNWDNWEGGDIVSGGGAASNAARMLMLGVG